MMNILTALAGASLVWIGWGFVMLRDMGPDSYIRSTFSPTFWRTGIPQ